MILWYHCTVIAIGGGDYPHLKGICYRNFPHVSPDCTAKSAPILQFGSVYRHSEILPNMIAMPNPVQLVCLLRWRSTRVSACPQFQQSGQDSELKFEVRFGCWYTAADFPFSFDIIESRISSHRSFGAEKTLVISGFSIMAFGGQIQIRILQVILIQEWKRWTWRLLQ